MEIVYATAVNEVLNLIIELTSCRTRLRSFHFWGGAQERFFPDSFPNFIVALPSLEKVCTILVSNKIIV